jgi:N-acetylglutamate synthase-like GNAT family acetyltransferase
MTEIVVRRAENGDRRALAAFIAERWGSEQIVVHERQYEPAQLDAFIAVQDGNVVGAATFAVENGACEIVTLDSIGGGRGVGTRLVGEVEHAAREANCKRVWLVTTNDNIEALRFYQRRGFRLVAVHRDAVMHARSIKPEIPLVGEHGIPIVDEIELERMIEA